MDVVTASLNLPHQLTSAVVERDSFKRQIETSAPNDGLRLTGPSVLAQLNRKVKDLEDEIRRQEIAQ